MSKYGKLRTAVAAAAVAAAPMPTAATAAPQAGSSAASQFCAVESLKFVEDLTGNASVMGQDAYGPTVTNNTYHTTLSVSNVTADGATFTAKGKQGATVDQVEIKKSGVSIQRFSSEGKGADGAGTLARRYVSCRSSFTPT